MIKVYFDTQIKKRTKCFNRINLILNFSERLPELFAKGTPEEKKSIIKCVTNSVEYNGEDLIVELKPTFEKLRNVKKHANFAVENHNLRTLSTPLDATKKDDLKSSFVNGAHNGLISEPFKELLNEFDSSESIGIFYRINLLKIA